MAPKNKFTKDEMIAAALRVVRAKGIGCLTAKAMADELGTSTRPIFTGFGSMDDVKQEVYAAAVRIYDSYTRAGLKEKIPFLGVGKSYIRFAREEPELYRLLFLTRIPAYSAMKSMQHLQALVRPTLMNIYHITAEEADLYFRNLWFVAHSLSTLIVTDDCVYLLPHRFTNYVSDNNATCTEDGTKTAVCDLCGAEKNTVKDAGSAKGHTWNEGVITKEATEEEPGVKTFTCTVCSATYTAEIPVLEHTHAFTQKVAEDTYLVKTATCTSAAVYHTSCRCGEAGTETFEYGDPLPHSFTNYVSDNNATCTEDGTKTATCDLCGEAKNTVRDTGSVKSHTWNEGVVTKEATADNEGEKTFTCQICQKTKTEVIPKKEQAPADPSKDNTKTAADNPSPTPTAEPEVIKPEITDTPSPTPTITNTSTPTPEVTSTQSPKTGDDNAWMLWTVLLMFSGIGLVSTGMIRRRRNG